MDYQRLPLTCGFAENVQVRALAGTQMHAGHSSFCRGFAESGEMMEPNKTHGSGRYES